MASIAKLENNTTLDNVPGVNPEEIFRFLVSLEHDQTIPSTIHHLIRNFVAEFTSDEAVSLLFVAPYGISGQQGDEIRAAIKEGGACSATCADIEVAHTNENPILPFSVVVVGDPAAFASGLPRVPGTQAALRQAFSASVVLRDASSQNKDQ